MSKSAWVKGGLILIISNLLSRVLGLGRDALLARAGGIGVEVDAYNLAFLIPDLLNHILGAGLLSVTLIPLIAPKLHNDQEGEAKEILESIFSWVMLALLILTSVAFIFAPQLLEMLSDKKLGGELAALSLRYTRIVLFAQVCFVAGGFFNAWQYAKYHYFLPALSPLIYNGGIILGGAIGLMQNNVEGFCWGVLVGALVGPFLLQLIGARRQGWKIKFSLKYRPEIKTYIMLTLPFALGVSMTFSNEFLSKFFGSAEPGGIAALGYGLRLTMAIVGVLGGAVGIAAYPYLSELCAKKEYGKVNEVLINTLLKVGVIVLPILPIVYWATPSLVEVYLGPKLSAVELQNVIKVTQGYLWLALPMSLQLLVNRTWYADQRTWTPAIISLIIVGISFPFYYVFEGLGLLRVPYVSAAACFVQLIFLIGLWVAKTKVGNWNHLIRPLSLSLILSMGVVVVLNKVTFFTSNSNSLMMVILFGAILAIFQWILIGWLGGNSANEFLKSLRRKILRF